MQQMPELVENRFDLPVRQQRGLVADRRRKIAADQSQVRLESVSGGAAGQQAVHPGAAALVLSRIPIGVESAEKRSVFVVDVVKLDVLVPSGNMLLFGDANSIEA